MSLTIRTSMISTHQMERWSSNSQIYSKQSPSKWYKISSGKKVIQDRIIYIEDVYLRLTFMRWVWWLICDFELLFSWTLKSTVKAPDLLIYLRSSILNLVDKYIKKRTRIWKLYFIESLSLSEWALWVWGPLPMANRVDYWCRQH
jgi:hypothetical protein